jgi:Glyoxalase/Bleomycin resistance protein/Dioxygenase superfamily
MCRVSENASPGGIPVQLDGIHHPTCITVDAPRNVDFYARALGLRQVEKTAAFVLEGSP